VSPSYKGHRYPVEVISHCVWLYFRFPLSLREVEELMLERGVTVSYETVRRWCGKFGQTYANALRLPLPNTSSTQVGSGLGVGRGRSSRRYRAAPVGAA
jgi:putative transposase